MHSREGEPFTETHMQYFHSDAEVEEHLATAGFADVHKVGRVPSDDPSTRPPCAPLIVPGYLAEWPKEVYVDTVRVNGLSTPERTLTTNRAIMRKNETPASSPS